MSSHPDIRCLIEPFHPKRYNGEFHYLATRRSLDLTLDCIWRRWNGIKHVWEASGWPFLDKPSLNDHIVSGPNRKIIFIARRNCLRRVVSNFLSRQTQYWIGNRLEFYARIGRTRIEAMNSSMVIEQIRRDQQSITLSLKMLKQECAEVLHLYYEDVFRENATPVEQFEFVNSLFEFVGAPRITFDRFDADCRPHFDPNRNRWASPDLYLSIPGIADIEAEVGCDETGWLFR
jgi:hypothetical protein